MQFMISEELPLCCMQRVACIVVCEDKTITGRDNLLALNWSSFLVKNDKQVTKKLLRISA